ncbi:MAG: hypothetical protein ACK5TH_18410 [Prosthecobacter sp.]|jgi:hypothetical protein
MKTLITCLCLVAAAFIFAADNTPPSPEGTQVGRYQIAAGTLPGVQTAPGITTAPITTTMRIDTVTGRVWQLQAVPLIVQGTTIPVHTWIECNEINGQLYGKALESMQTK